MVKRKGRAKPFLITRKHHADEAAEDYTELIADIAALHGQARTCEIAKHLGVSHVTALRTMRRLQQQGYLTTARHQPVLLTRKGQLLSEYCKYRHKLLVDFFVELGVSRRQAELDVEGAEHHISAASLKMIERYMSGDRRQ